MIRLYKQVADYIAFWMVYIRDKEMYKDISPLEHVHGAYPSRNVTTDDQAMINNIVRHFSGIEQSHEEITKDLVTQIYQTNTGVKVKHDSDLIDSIVRLLNLPYGPNAISGKTVDALRKSILVPDELAGLKARLDRDERACSSCGRELVQNEMVTVARSSTGRVSLHCGVCAIPSVVACQGCKEGKSILSKLTMKHLRKNLTCEVCNAGTQPVDPEAVSDVQIRERGSARLDEPGQPFPTARTGQGPTRMAFPAGTTVTTGGATVTLNPRTIQQVEEQIRFEQEQERISRRQRLAAQFDQFTGALGRDPAPAQAVDSIAVDEMADFDPWEPDMPDDGA